MSNGNKFIYFTGAQVEKTKSENFKVTLEEEEYIIYVSSKDVYRIKQKVDETEELIAIVLAYIEYVFQYTKVFGQKKNAEQEVIVDNLIFILSRMPAEEFIERIKNIKWHEILEIFESGDPVQKIREMT